MSEIDLRSAFPLAGNEFTSDDGYWTCHLIEVSDLRPAEDRLSWFFAFHPMGETSAANERLRTRMLEIVTASRVLDDGWPADLKQRMQQWLASADDDGRLDWSDA